jgi:peptidoglycan-N-acetylglucosamine deacetylase
VAGIAIAAVLSSSTSKKQANLPVVALGAGGDVTRSTTAQKTTTQKKEQLSPRQLELLREDKAIDGLLRRTWFISRGSKKKKQIALTFDDGPGPYTNRIVSILERMHVPATFFQVGFMIPEFPAVMKREVARGFTFGDHTEQHPNLAGKPRAFQRDQLHTPLEWLHKFGAPKPRLFRPPYGSYDETTKKLLKKMHMLAVFWTIDTNDWKQPGSKAIVQSVLGGAGPGDIVLMHDGGGNRNQTIAALPAIVKGLRKRGYQLVSVPRMIADDPPPRHQHQPLGLEGG